ncbi:hypothetical protein DSECCO2_485320 [anaerobic digester metagenome]
MLQVFEQPVRKVVVEERRVDDKVRVALQERLIDPVAGERRLPGRGLPDTIQVAPLSELSRVRQNLGVELLRHVVEGHAVAGPQDELLLLPECLLEILDLRQKVDDPVGDGLEHLRTLHVALHRHLILRPEIVEPEDLVLDVEVQLLPEEPAKILVDEEVARVLPCKAHHVLVEQRLSVSIPLVRLQGVGEPLRDAIAPQDLGHQTGHDVILIRLLATGARWEAPDEFVV